MKANCHASTLDFGASSKPLVTLIQSANFCNTISRQSKNGSRNLSSSVFPNLTNCEGVIEKCRILFTTSTSSINKSLEGKKG